MAGSGLILSAATSVGPLLSVGYCYFSLILLNSPLDFFSFLPLP